MTYQENTGNLDRLMTSLLDRHNQGASENEISVRIRDLIIGAGIADADEITMEEHPEDNDVRRVDIFVRNTFIEVKRDITSNIHGNLNPRWVPRGCRESWKRHSEWSSYGWQGLEGAGRWGQV